MFDNPVLDVAIGLAFIYVLYSLLATTVKEFIATIFAYRGKMLERGIEQMLDGRNYKYFWWDRVFNLFLKHFQKIETKKQAKDLCKKLVTAKKEAQDKEDNETQPKAEKNINRVEQQQISLSNKAAILNNKAAFYSKQPINDGLKKGDVGYVVRRKLNSKASLFSREITNHPLYKRAAENQATFSSSTPSIPSYLTASTFSDIFMDILRDANSPVILLKDVETKIKARAANNSDPFGKELAKILIMYLRQANGDVQRFKLLIENWYDDMMNRVSGWYKRQANYILLIIGFCVAVAFNVNSIAIVKKLSTDKPTRDALVKNAQDYVRDHAKDFKLQKPGQDVAAVDSTNAKNDSSAAPKEMPKTDSTIKANTNAKDSPKADSAKKAHNLAIAKAAGNKAASANPAEIKNENKNNVNNNAAQGPKPEAAPQPDDVFADTKIKLKLMDSLYKDITPNNNLLGLGWGDLGRSEDSAKCAREQSSKYNDYMGQLKAGKKADAPWERGFWNTLWFFVTHIFNPLNLLGFFITAFAISLGAPFWFDLLNKFINLRVSGTKPDDTTSDATKKNNLTKQPDPTAKA